MEYANTKEHGNGIIKFMNGENDDFEPIPIPKEVDDEMQKDRFY